MIIECPACRTRYLVPDTAIGVDGRTVRCANCRHSWFEDGVRLDRVAAPPPPAASPPPAAADVDDAPTDRPASQGDRVEPVAPPISPPAPPPPPSPPIANFVEETAPFRPRRNPARRWTMIAAAAGLLMIVAIALIMWLDVPGFASRMGLPVGSATTPLTIVEYPIERRDLPNGSEVFAISGRIVNDTGTVQRVPSLRAELRDAQDRIVFSWTVRPERRTLAARSSVDFNSAQLDVPANSKSLVLSFAAN